MANSNDLIVFDDEYKYAASEIRAYGNALSKLMDGYVHNLKYVMDAAIKDELITEALQSLLEQIYPLADIVNGITHQISGECNTFVDEIDVADDFLY